MSRAISTPSPRPGAPRHTRCSRSPTNRTSRCRIASRALAAAKSAVDPGVNSMLVTSVSGLCPCRRPTPTPSAATGSAGSWPLVIGPVGRRSSASPPVHPCARGRPTIAFAIDLPIDQPSSGVSASKPGAYCSATMARMHHHDRAGVLLAVGVVLGEGTLHGQVDRGAVDPGGVTRDRHVHREPAGHGWSAGKGWAGRNGAKPGSSSANVHPTPGVYHEVESHRPNSEVVTWSSVAVVRRNGTKGWKAGRTGRLHGSTCQQ